MFKRKDKQIAAEQSQPQEQEVDGESADSTTSSEPLDESAFHGAAASVPPGPYDASDVPPSPVNRVDLGAIQVAGFTDMQLHFETDPSKTTFVSVVAAYRDAALRLQALAAPRSGGLWDDMRPQITASITGAGGDVEEVQGVFGTELHGVVPAVTPDGQQVRQPVRLVGVEGPRWMLHGVFMGSAPMDERMTELFEDVFSQVVVVRGSQPMAPGEVLPLVLPPDAQQQAAPPTDAQGDPGQGPQAPGGAGSGLLA